MKKFTLAAVAAMAALSASAQYTAATPYANASNGKIFDLITCSDVVKTGLESAGKTVNDYRTNDETRWLYVWDNTFVGGDATYPGVGYDDMQFDGYPAFEVGTVGWSGAGFNINKGVGINTAHWTDQTRFHAAFRSNGTAPASIALVICDKDDLNKPGRIAVGDAFNDNGTVYPAVAPALGEDWVAVDIAFSDIKKFTPDFNAGGDAAWTGNILSFLAGGVAGRAFAMDAIYFYTPEGGEGAVEGVADDAEFVVTDNTINVAGAKGIELYDMQGRLVARSNGSVLGTEGLNGIYVAKAGNAVKKIMK